MSKGPYKIFIWDKALRDYTAGIMFAIDRDIEGARKQLLVECSYIPKEDLEREPLVLPVSKRVCRVVWGGG